jgi:hypothetical protein
MLARGVKRGKELSGRDGDARQKSEIGSVFRECGEEKIKYFGAFLFLLTSISAIQMTR